MTHAELRALIERMNITQREGAVIAAVGLRQFQKWISGTVPIPILAANALICAEAERDEAKFEAEIGTGKQTPADRRQMLADIAAEQRRRIAIFERDLSEERDALAETLAQIKDG